MEHSTLYVTEYSIFLLWTLVLFLSFSFVFYLNSHTYNYNSNTLSRSNDGIEYGEYSPYPELNDVYNNPINLKDFNGSNAMLFFLSNSCHMCQGIFEIIPEIQMKYKNSNIIILMKDDSQSPFTTAEDLYKRFPSFPMNDKTKVILLTPEIQESFKLIGFPFAYNLSKKGIIVNKGIINTMKDIDTLMKGF